MVQYHRRLFLIIGLFLTFFTLEGFSEECTTGILSGDVTNSGRPILWKNRDSSFKDNEAAFFSRGGTQFIGIINADDTTQVWAGVNNHGFAIMNAESRDMAVPGEETRFDDEGVLMKIALIHCQTVLDFENLLISTNETGRAVTSNFGVIDA
ncbi:MAG: peptidase C45, partial [Candidatus Neomarinimicrobiota bacterium]